MISYLEGKIIQVNDSFITVLTKSGVGYRVNFQSDHKGFIEGEEAKVYIYTHVRENEISLYGFDTDKDRIVFELLISVSGVGPKAAQSILAKHQAEGVISAILSSNSEGLRVSGVGVKTADKIVLELRDKLIKRGYEVDKSGNLREDESEKIDKELYAQIEQAFISLGFSKNEIKSTISDIIHDNPNLSKVEDFVREGLKRM